MARSHKDVLTWITAEFQFVSILTIWWDKTWQSLAPTKSMQESFLSKLLLFLDPMQHPIMTVFNHDLGGWHRWQGPWIRMMDVAYWFCGCVQKTRRHHSSWLKLHSTQGTIWAAWFQYCWIKRSTGCQIFGYLPPTASRMGFCWSQGTPLIRTVGDGKN